MMKTAAVFAVAASVLPNVLALTINSPNSLTTCEPAKISWTGGSPPYFVTVIPGNQPSAAALVTLENNSTATSVTWTVNTEGSVTLEVLDSQGDTAFSSAVTIQTGSDTSCVNVTNSATGSSSSSSASSGSSSSDSSSSSSGSSSSGSSSASTDSSSSPTSAASGGSSSSTSAASSSSSSAASNGALPAVLNLNYGIAGFAALVFATLI